MSASKLSTRLVIFVVVSLMTHLLELAASGVFCHTLMQQADLRMPWFSIAAGLLILPLVAIQLASAVCLLRRKGEASTSCEIATTAILHILQLGFISRHFIILRETSLPSKRTEIIELTLLRVSFAFMSGSTLFFVQVYFLLLQSPHEGTWVWAVYFSGAANLMSVTWAVSAFRRCLPEADFSVLLITWPGTALRMFWRGGELLARIIAAALFASLYIHFLFLVMALHWVSVLVCLYIPLITSIQWPACGSVKKTFIRILISFIHIFIFINTSADNAVFRYTFYYVIFFLENAALITVWFVQSSPEYVSRNSIFAYVAVIAFSVSLTAMIIYYKYFHVPLSKAGAVRNCENSSCMTCNLADTSNSQTDQQGVIKASISLAEAPESGSSYQQQQMHYFKQEGIIGSNSGANHKGRSSRQNANSLSQSNTENTSSSVDGFEVKHKGTHEYTALELKVSTEGIQGEQISYQESPKRPIWLPSGDSSFANQLLTYTLDNFDAAETADSEQSSDVTDYIGHSSSSRVICYDTGSLRNISKAGQHATQQKPAQSPGHDTVCAHLRHSEHICTCTCQCSCETLDMPALGQDLAIPPSSKTEATLSAFPPCLHADIHRNHYHHHHHRKGYSKAISPVTVKDLSSLAVTSSPTDDLSTEKLKLCPQCSPVYGPSCDKTKARITCYDHKLCTSAIMDTLPPFRDPRNTGNNLHQEQTCLPVKDVELSVTQNDKLATELLKSSFYSENHAKSNTPDTTTPPTSDPRFSVRVMTSPASENSCSSVNFNSGKAAKDIHAFPNDIDKYSDLAPQNIHQRKRKTRPKTCDVADAVTHPENARNKVVHYENKDEVKLDNNNPVSTTSASKDREDSVYENLWPSEETQQLRQTEGWDRNKMSANTRSGRSDKRDICSESEDSALPMEFLSSSAEVFTASNSDSDVSLEIVI